MSQVARSIVLVVFAVHVHFALAQDTAEVAPTTPEPTIADRSTASLNLEATGRPAYEDGAAGCARPYTDQPLTASFQIPPDAPHDLTYFLGYDSWRGVQDGGWANNGLHTGLNFGTRLGQFSEWTGIGAQVGATLGVYDWSGTDYRFKNRDIAETQGFLTFGLFRRPTDDSRVSAAVVNDWMFNHTFGVLAESPTLSQWRWQLSYAVNDWNEVGVWGTTSGQSDSNIVGPFGDVLWQNQNQYNFFARHKWAAGGADTSIYVGVPEHGRLAEVPVGSRNIGSFIAGAVASVPMGDHVSLYSHVAYMHPAIGAGEFASNDEMWQVFTGISYCFGGRARSADVCGKRWSPLMPVSNNGYFMVDTNKWY